MNRLVRILLCCLTLALAGAWVFFALDADRRERSLISCNSISVEFRDSCSLVSEDDVCAFLSAGYGPWIGERIDSIGLSKMEAILNGRGAIKDAEAWVTGDGILHVGITQRKPVVKVTDGSRGFYLDSECREIPLNPSCSVAVPVFEGFIPESAEWRRQIVGMAGMMETRRLWPERFCSFSVAGDGSITISSTEGKEVFIFGQPDRLEEKFLKIDRYRSRILPKVGEDHYRSVNVQFDKQIICRQ